MTASITLLDEVRSGLKEGSIQRAAEHALQAPNVEREVGLTIRLVNDQRIKLLNQGFLGKNEPTDVLSFPVHEFASGNPPANLPPGPLLLGEVVVNLDQARRQADTSGHDLLREVQSLVEHGVRHLIGFHHQDSKHG